LKSFLFKWLVFPLMAAAIVSMLVSLCVPDPWRSLLVNLAATFLGSIVTVFFVETILRRGEEQRWKKFQGHVGKQVSTLANGTASSVRNALAIPPPDIRNEEGMVPNQVEMRQI
jgi:peptidoglycan/LPS O-acetylase OafA/YrhL